MSDKRRKPSQRLTLDRETVRELPDAELTGVVGGEQRPWLTAWTCRSCPDVSCACDA